MGGYVADGTTVYMCDITPGTPATITGVTITSGIVTVTGTHDFARGDLIHITGVVGITELNQYHLVSAISTTVSFDIDAGHIEGTYVSGGTATKIYTSRLQLGCVTSYDVSETSDEIDLPCLDDPAGLKDFAVGNASGAFTMDLFYLPNNASHDPVTGVAMVQKRKIPIGWIIESPQVSAVPPIEAFYGTITTFSVNGTAGGPKGLSIGGRLNSRHLLLAGA